MSTYGDEVDAWLSSSAPVPWLVALVLTICLAGVVAGWLARTVRRVGRL